MNQDTQILLPYIVPRIVSAEISLEPDPFAAVKNMRCGSLAHFFCTADNQGASEFDTVEDGLDVCIAQ
jgi:hypothetical protein